MVSIFSRIPDKAEFPWGYEIKAYQVPEEDGELEGRHAAWDVDTQTIWLARGLPIAQRRYCFIHELDHAWNDWKAWVGQNARLRIPEEPVDDDDQPGTDGDGVGNGPDFLRTSTARSLRRLFDR